jgi:hypothetical protein
MPELTPAQMLAEVNIAIQKILVGGQSYRIGSRQLNRADLGMLRQMQRELENQVVGGDNANTLGNFSVAEFDRR